MSSFYAQPYDISATGFYFEILEEYEEKSSKLVNDAGFPVEEFEIQFIDGEDIDCKLFDALGLSQCNIGPLIDAAESWGEWQKIIVILAVGECGYDFDPEDGNPDDFDIDIYEMDSMKELAEHFVDEGLFGEIPESLIHYIDYDAIARDLSTEYSEARITGRRFIYRYV